MSALVVTSMGGVCPTQAEGEMDGNPFYFRARHGVWNLTVVKPGCDAAWPKKDDVLLTLDGDDPTHGWMNDLDVMAILAAAFDAVTTRSEVQP